MVKVDLRDLSPDGKVYLVIRGRDNDSDVSVFDAFKTMALSECRNDYVLTLRKLLEYYESDAKYSSLAKSVDVLEARVAALELLFATKSSDAAGGAF